MCFMVYKTLPILVSAHRRRYEKLGVSTISGSRVYQCHTCIRISALSVSHRFSDLVYKECRAVSLLFCTEEGMQDFVPRLDPEPDRRSGFQFQNRRHFGA